MNGSCGSSLGCEAVQCRQRQRRERSENTLEGCPEATHGERPQEDCCALFAHVVCPRPHCAREKKEKAYMQPQQFFQNALLRFRKEFTQYSEKKFL